MTGDRTRCSVAIAGAGITGLSIAWHLAQRGVRGVRVFDGSGIAAGATGIQPGGVRQQWGNAVTCRMAREAFRFYSGLGERLGVAVDARLDRCGYLFTAHGRAGLEQLEANVRLQNRVGVPSRMVDPSEAVELVPGLSDETLVGAAWCGEDGYVDRPQAVVAGFADGARRGGVDFVGTHVRRLGRAGGGWRLELADGRAVLAEQVVVATAHEAPALLAPLGIALPVTREWRFLFYSAPIRERLLEPLVVSPERHFAAKQLADGSVLASDLRAEGDPELDKAAWHRHVRTTITELVPILEYVSFPVLVPGTYDVTPDHQPILGRFGGADGLWVAAGLNGRGFMMAPPIGRSLAAAVAGGEVDEQLAALDPGRFERGALATEQQVV